MRRSGLLLLAALLLGNAALLLVPRRRMGALQRLHRDTSGAAFEAAPDSAMRVDVEGYAFDYRMPSFTLEGMRDTLPARTGADGGLADVRAAVRWVRGRLRAGEHFDTRRHWQLAALLAAAADTSVHFYCDNYSRAVVAACQSMGYPARVVQLDGHITSEVFLPERGQWVMADALYDFIALGLDEAPLSAAEAGRRLKAGGAVEWRPVVGAKEDDDWMDPRTRAQVEGILRRGGYFVADGPTTFGRLRLAERLRALLMGRPRVIQLLRWGEPPLDRIERWLRWALVAWNAAGLLTVAVAARRRAARGRRSRR